MKIIGGPKKTFVSPHRMVCGKEFGGVVRRGVGDANFSPTRLPLFFLPFLTLFISLFFLISAPSDAFATPCLPLVCLSADVLTPNAGQNIQPNPDPGHSFVQDLRFASTTLTGSQDFLAGNDSGHTNGNGSASATYGSLHAIAITDTTSPQFTNGFPNGGVPRGETRASATFVDRISFISGQLPFGTPVQVRFEMSGSGMMTKTGNSLDAFILASGSLRFNGGFILGFQVNNGGTDIQEAIGAIINPLLDIGGRIIGSEVSFDQSAIVTSFVGSGFPLQGALQIVSDSSTLPDCLGCFAYPESLVQALFGDTANYQITVLTPGVSFTSEGGGTYSGPAPAVPEPSTWLLLGAGLAGLAAWRRKKAA